MGGCISTETEEIKKVRQSSRQRKKQEWEKRYQKFAKKVKDLYTPDNMREVIWQDSKAKRVIVHSELRTKKIEECEKFMNEFNRREKKPRLYKSYIGSKYNDQRVIIYYRI